MVLFPAPLWSATTAIVPFISKLILLIAFSLVVSYLNPTLLNFMFEFFKINFGASDHP